MGQNSYLAKRVDGIVDGVLRNVLDSLQSIPKCEVVDSGLSALQDEMELTLKNSQRDYLKASTDVAELKNEVLKSIRGESNFTPGLLNDLIAEAEERLAEIESVRDMARHELDNCKYRIAEIQEKYDEVISWTELYDSADLSAKKMIVANMINRIDVGADYDIHIDFSFDLTHFNIQYDSCTFGQSKTA